MISVWSLWLPTQKRKGSINVSVTEGQVVSLNLLPTVLGGKETSGLSQNQANRPNLKLSLSGINAAVIGLCQIGTITAWHRNQNKVPTSESTYALRWGFGNAIGKNVSPVLQHTDRIL